MTKKLSAQELVPFGQNLLQNSTFAMGKESWSVYNGMTLTPQRNGAGFYGILSGSINSTLNQKFSIQYATEITISLEAAQGSFLIGIELFNSANEYIGVGTSDTISPTTVFGEKRHTKTFAITSDVHFINFYIQKKDTTDILIRNIKIENKGVATPYSNEGDIYVLGSPAKYIPTLINGATIHTGLGHGFWRIGNRVHFNLRIFKTSNEWYICNSIPTEYRPKKLEYYTGHCITNSTGALEGYFTFSINENGFIQIQSAVNGADILAILNGSYEA